MHNEFSPTNMDLDTISAADLIIDYFLHDCDAWGSGGASHGLYRYHIKVSECCVMYVMLW